VSDPELSGELAPEAAGEQTEGSSPLMARADFLHAIIDGLIALAAAVVVALLGLVIVVNLLPGHVVNGAGDYFAVAVWLTGASLGTPVHETAATAFPGNADGSLNSGTEVRAAVWLLTLIVLMLVFRLARRRERSRPSASLPQFAIRGLLPAVVLTLVLLVLALVTDRTSIFGFPGLGGDGNSLSPQMSTGLEPGFVFVGPLLLTAAAGMFGRLATCVRSAAGGPLPRRLHDALGQWSPAMRVSWLQVRIIGLITGVTLWIYISVEVGSHTNSVRETAALTVGLFLLLPNLAIYGTFGGFGTTIYGTAITTSSGTGLGGPGRDVRSYDIGIAASHRPWIVWLLLAAALLGTLAPTLLVKRGMLAKRGEDYRWQQVWRATAIGTLSAVAVVLLGTLSLSGYTSSHGFSFRSDLSLGPNLLAAAGLTAVWVCVAYLAVSFASRKPRPLQAKPSS